MLELCRCVSTFREELQLTFRMIKCVDTRQSLRALQAVDEKQMIVLHFILCFIDTASLVA